MPYFPLQFILSYLFTAYRTTHQKLGNTKHLRQSEKPSKCGKELPLCDSERSLTVTSETRLKSLLTSCSSSPMVFTATPVRLTAKEDFWLMLTSQAMALEEIHTLTQQNLGPLATVTFWVRSLKPQKLAKIF